jgi:hypothetical protein
MQHMRAGHSHLALFNTVNAFPLPQQLVRHPAPPRSISATSQSCQRPIVRNPTLRWQLTRADAVPGSSASSNSNEQPVAGGFSKSFAAIAAFVQAQYLPLALSTALAIGCLAPQLGVAAAGFNVSVVVTTAIFVLQVIYPFHHA